MKKGKFIVLDGTDGSGKATQTNILVKKLKKEGKKVKTIDFPQYKDNFFGKMIGECLVGDYGDFIAVDPHIASALYAADRWESSEMINKWISNGYIVIADRYTSSNQIHQGGKIKDSKKRREFLKWLEKMEFEVLRIPKPDAIVYLDVPYEITKKLLQEKNAINKKKYSIGKKDLAENNKKHLSDSRKSAIKLVGECNNWIKIDCVKKGEMMSIEEINEIIWSKVSKIVK
ncbi:MAG: Thymidylate kinase [Candidatus Moranbacteria bacterium GW2011_GWE2_35_2-]|nr:MAG: Thymidylate kinase [Candidatus Moranbacteria bacterium GW2011_GWE2_35_2-]KKQ06901.1 MAG: Thymidylate kinase [Candidatus Moranbacteria bacterium GW2011_GWF1_36_4]KKQ22097.1 MAG: Thymidylate kinase [Candidatus Moranbacteria bacterium GW2011_GWF2_37_11]KKQ29150.1 MAG: Thymidylate kinase [Candidatus Moranbacteria bacterium GW2011_GWD1_37_17]KKQ31135.1 MAG: Thymidylate kinase [Candidatus Moranbacteria bacterium GW2011_GWE1_37_24]KKQ47064.1 MAG: Thymidylate kinase [Candidatus Moranbacteria b